MSKWEKVKLGEIAEIQGGYAFKSSEFTKNEIPIIRIGNINGETVGLDYSICYPKEFWTRNQSYQIKYDDILIAMSGATIGKIGKYLMNEPALLNQRVGLIRPMQLKLDSNFIYHYLKSDKFINQILLLSVGCAQPNISTKQIGNIEIPLPPLETQKQIAITLDTVAELLAMRKQQLAELDNLIKSTFYEMFGDPVENEKGWEVVKLSDFYQDPKTSVKCGPFGSALKKEEYVESGIPVWVMDNITKNGEFICDVFLYITKEKYEELKSYNVKKNDIIISRAGTVGKMCVVTTDYDDSIISTNLIRLRLNNNLLPLYVVKLISTWGSKISRLKKGAEGSFTHMNTGVLDNIVFPYPPLEIQNHFASIVNQIENQKSLVKQSIDETQYLFDSLMSQYIE